MSDSTLFQNVIEGIFSAAFLASILRVTTPILLPSLGALISDRAGVINIGLEGTMLASAFTGVVFSAYAQDWFGQTTGEAIGPWLGLAMGMVIGLLMALILAFFHLKLKADLILSGIALNVLGSAATVAIMFELTGDRGNTKGNLDSMKMPFVQLPDFLNDIPVVSFFFRIFDNQSVMTWIAFIMVGLVWYFMYRTPTGTHLRAVGENPEAAASVGIRVQRVRYLALLLSGFMAGLGGIHMSMGYLTFFQKDMTSGRGFIALATPYLGGGNPIGTGLASLIFGFFDAISTRIGSLEVPSQLPQMVPFIATVMALVIYALQQQLTTRVRTLRSAEGEGFDAQYWRAIQRLSVLHMFLMMTAVIGILVTVSMFSAPDGFDDPWLRGSLVGVASLILIGINLPFITHVERIGQWSWWYSAGASVLSMWVYLGLFFVLFLVSLDSKGTITLADTALVIAGFVIGLAAGIAIWLRLGGAYLMRNHRSADTNAPAPV
jgi:simple sugar transport system permease protein